MYDYMFDFMVRVACMINRDVLYVCKSDVLQVIGWLYVVRIMLRWLLTESLLIGCDMISFGWMLWC